MHVLATAGHVDHGKSTLVRALTGMEPDRWAEERRRGMTIDLGYAWMRLPSGEELAFVDVPGHQRFISNMLAGIGPVPAALMVVAADEGWRRQSTEHLAALNAIGIRYGLLAVTRSDLADPEPAMADARQRLAASSLGQVEVVAVSALSGRGLSELRGALDRLVARLRPADTERRVRLWVDRSFTVRGSGTVVTGTLAAGTITVGDQLQVRQRRVRVRGLHQLGRPTQQACAVARVAVNLRSTDVDTLRRGDALLTPDSWHVSDTIDVRLSPLLGPLGRSVIVHVGSASVAATVRMLGDDTARLTLHRQLPWEVGDRAILRDAGQHTIVAGATVLDADPPPLRRRGATGQRARELATLDPYDWLAHVRARGAAQRSALLALGYPDPSLTTASDGTLRCVGDWLIDEDTWRQWSTGLLRQIDEHAQLNPQQPWMPEEAIRKALALPADRQVLQALVAATSLNAASGRIGRPGARVSLGPAADAAVQTLQLRWRSNPFDAPTRTELTGLGLSAKHIAAAASAGLLARLTPDLLLAADVVERAATILGTLPQPFTTSAARQVLQTSRRVTIPLLEHLDTVGITQRVSDTTRTLSGTTIQPAASPGRHPTPTSLFPDSPASMPSPKSDSG